MQDKQLLREIAKLEFEHDQLLAEMEYIDKLLRRVGFSDGLETVKWAAKDLVEEHCLDEES